MTVRQMMIAVGLSAVMLALHTPALRDVIRHEERLRDPEFRAHPPRVMRENYVYSLSTIPTLLALALFDVFALTCWLWYRKAAKARSSTMWGDRQSRSKPREHY
jgi:hypothetical protein